VNIAIEDQFTFMWGGLNHFKHNVGLMFDHLCVVILFHGWLLFLFFFLGH